MATTGIFHHVGTFLLFAASILLLITSISSPVVDNIGILKVKLSNATSDHHSAVTFGTFGFCVLDVAGSSNHQDQCTTKHIGYNPVQVMEGIDNTNFNLASTDTIKGLTRVMILHPIAAGVAFIAFLLALGSGFCGAILGAVTAVVAWIIALAVMVTDFILFGLVKRHVNRDGSGSSAGFSTGMWTLVAAMLCLFLGAIIVFFTCCSSRMHRRSNAKHVESGYANGAGVTRRHFWQRSSRTTKY